MHIIYGGKDDYRKTDDFLTKEVAIRTEIELKYKVLLTFENNIFKRAKIQIQKQIALRKALSKLVSKDILFLGSPNN